MGHHETEHDRNLLDFLNRAREVHLKLRNDKCRFKVKEVPYIGNLLTPQGLKPDPKRFEQLWEWRNPRIFPQKFIPSLTHQMFDSDVECQKYAERCCWKSITKITFSEVENCIANLKRTLVTSSN